MIIPKRYIGDGVYVDFDGYALVLTTEDGISVTNRIVLEPEVYSGLKGFVASLNARDTNPKPYGQKEPV